MNESRLIANALKIIDVVNEHFIERCGGELSNEVNATLLLQSKHSLIYGVALLYVARHTMRKISIISNHAINGMDLYGDLLHKVVGQSFCAFLGSLKTDRTDVDAVFRQAGCFIAREDPQNSTPITDEIKAAMYLIILVNEDYKQCVADFIGNYRQELINELVNYDPDQEMWIDEDTVEDDIDNSLLYIFAYCLDFITKEQEYGNVVFLGSNDMQLFNSSVREMPGGLIAQQKTSINKGKEILSSLKNIIIKSAV